MPLWGGGSRVLLQAGLTLRQYGFPVALVAGLAAAAATVAVYSPPLAVGLLTLYPLFYALGAVLPAASGLAEELSSGRSQVYLAAGLSRAAYTTSWLLVLVAYPAFAVALGMVVPPLLLKPAALQEPLALAGLQGIDYATIAAAAAVTAAEMGALAALAATSRSRGAVVAAALASSVLVPMFTPIVAALTLPSTAAAKVAPLAIAAFNAYYALLMATVSPAIQSSPQPHEVLAAAAAATLAYIAAAYMAQRRLEH